MKKQERETGSVGTNNQADMPGRRHAFVAGTIGAGIAETVGTVAFLATLPPELAQQVACFLAPRAVPLGVLGAVVGGAAAQEIYTRSRRRG